MRRENIFPFQEDADIMFNSALIYELGVLKKYAQPLLAQITPEQVEYVEAKLIIEFFQHILSILMMLRSLIIPSCGNLLVLHVFVGNKKKR